MRAVVSPHLDDAVLSCWHVLTGPGAVVVVNVFDGVPAADAPLGWWDLRTAATSSAERMRERRAEDRAALALTGRHGIGLGLLDDQYRDSAPPADDIAALIADVLDPAIALCAPVAFDGHPDHVLARDAALVLARAGRRVSLYADLPHATADGWPAWVTGDRREGADVDAAWSRALADTGLETGGLVARVRPLGSVARARKLRAISAYRTQRQALDAVSFAPLDDPRALGWEVGWEVTRSALRDLREPGREAVVVDPGGKPAGDRR
jgi:LmbE family N-acetylglucosaminyl deacetylase